MSMNTLALGRYLLVLALLGSSHDALARGAPLHARGPRMSTRQKLIRTGVATGIVLGIDQAFLGGSLTHSAQELVRSVMQAPLLAQGAIVATAAVLAQKWAKLKYALPGSGTPPPAKVTSHTAAPGVHPSKAPVPKVTPSRAAPSPEAPASQLPTSPSVAAATKAAAPAAERYDVTLGAAAALAPSEAVWTGAHSTHRTETDKTSPPKSIAKGSKTAHADQTTPRQRAAATRKRRGGLNLVHVDGDTVRFYNGRRRYDRSALERLGFGFDKATDVETASKLPGDLMRLVRKPRSDQPTRQALREGIAPTRASLERLLALPSAETKRRKKAKSQP